MTFSSSIKKELARQKDKARHCQLAELAAILGQSGEYGFRDDGSVVLTVSSDKNLLILAKTEELLREAFAIVPEVSVGRSREWTRASYSLVVQDPEDLRRVLRGTKTMLENGVLLELRLPADRRLLQSECCRKAYLRGLFLCSGSVNDPEKSYHLEISFEHPDRAGQVVELLKSFGIDARTTVRKNQTIVYIKESDGIGDVFRIMGAAKGLMDYENARIVRSLMGDVNRKVNCDVANINKVIAAGHTQIEEIRLIQERMGLEKLSDSLREAALARLESPETSLEELGKSMDPPVGKSGMNHRFRRIKMIAEKLRDT